MTTFEPLSFSIEWLDRVDYQEAQLIQEQAVTDRRDERTGDRLLLLEHPDVITLGRNAKEHNLLTSREKLLARGVAVHEVARGGDVTFHGPGQLVGYPIFDLKSRGTPDVFLFLRKLETALIQALGLLGVHACRVDGMTGVFISGSAPRRKIASIGIGVKRWVTFHGFALNVLISPKEFNDIVPCGLEEVEITSVSKELGESSSISLFKTARTSKFRQKLTMRQLTGRRVPFLVRALAEWKRLPKGLLH